MYIGFVIDNPISQMILMGVLSQAYEFEVM